VARTGTPPLPPVAPLPLFVRHLTLLTLAEGGALRRAPIRPITGP